MKWSEYGQIVSVSNSLRKYYGLHLYHDSDAQMDEWLNQNAFRCVVVLLIDAMGVSILNEHVQKDGFFLSNLKKEITTTFPPTTSAATTSFRNGKTPMENAWLGWNEYFPEVDDNIILFLNQAQYSEQKYPGFINEHLPVSTMVEELNEQKIQADEVWPEWGVCHPSKTYQDLLDHTLECVTKNPQLRYLYTYWDAFDTNIHHYGPHDCSTHEMLVDIEKRTEQFAQQLPMDCGLVIIADHSQIEIHQDNLEKHPDLCGCFLHEPAIEPRAMSFSIKEDCHEKFVQAFQKEYGDTYTLYSKDEVIQQKIFGEGIEHPRFREFLGDYLAIAISDLEIQYKKGQGTIGDHAGGVDEEAIIPLILYRNSSM